MKLDVDVFDVVTFFYKVFIFFFNFYKVNLLRKYLVYIIYVCLVYVNVFVDKGIEKVRNFFEEM